MAEGKAPKASDADYVAVTRYGGQEIARAKKEDCLSYGKRTYFPASAVKTELLKFNGHTQILLTRGTLVYYDVIVGEQVIEGAAWQFVNGEASANWGQGLHTSQWLLFILEGSQYSLVRRRRGYGQ